MSRVLDALHALLPLGVQQLLALPKLAAEGGSGSGSVDWRAVGARALALALAVAGHPLVFYPAAFLFVLWVLIEVAFYFYLRYIVLPELNRLTQPVDSVHTSWDQFHKIIDLVARLKGGKYDFNRFFSGWFLNAEIKDIRRGNIREMLAWVLYAKAQGDLSVREKACMEDVLYWLKMRFQMDAPEGYNPKVRPMMLTLEKIHYVHRPLAYYAILTGLQVVGHAVLMFLGFKRHEINGIAYWYRSCPRNIPPQERSLPLVFFHGISPGLNMYLTLVHTLSKNRKAVLVEVPHIAMCLNFKAQRLGDMVKTVEIISKRHRMPHFAVAGHSFGSLPAAWVTKHLRHSVKQLILLDPVSLLLGLPDVCYNFLHKKPASPMEYIVHYLGATEITIHHTLRRQFWWYEGQLFLDEVRCPAFIGLSGHDEIVPSETLRVYVEDFLDRHHADEHARYERMRAHRHHLLDNDNGGNGNGNGTAAPAAVIAESAASAAPLPGEASPATDEEDSGAGAGAGAPCCNHDVAYRCELGKGGKGCLRQRIQLAFWDGWSHGEILFRLPTLYALDKQLRDQERFFRTREVEETMAASMRPLPRSLSSKLAANGGGNGGGGVGRGASLGRLDHGRRGASLPGAAMRQRLAAAAAASQGSMDVSTSKCQSLRGGPGGAMPPAPETPSGVVDGETDKSGQGQGQGRGVSWHPSTPGVVAAADGVPGKKAV